ncbi:MAG: 30S ribosome-binding factor RbfA [Planctomycetota bacterium]|nr:30S ribosome-binding factor RbfA [Planctomycetota bacterium]
MAIRTERLKEVIRETAAQFIQQDLNDPRVGFCTVTHIDLSSDLSFATVHVSVFGDDAQKRTTMRGLNDARGMLQSRIARVMKTRTTPHITIELDESVEKSFRILDKIKEARASDPDHGLSTQEPAAAGDPDADDEAEVEEDEEDEEEEDEEEDSDEDSEDEDEPDADEEEAEEAPAKPAPKAPARKKRTRREENDDA